MLFFVLFVGFKIMLNMDYMLNISVIQMADFTFCERKLNLVSLRRKNHNSASLFQKEVTKPI